MSEILKKNLICFVTVFIFIFVFRFFPHPPNFTPILALTLYTSAFFGLRSCPYIIFAFALSDLFIGFHQLLIFTWGSLILISLLGKYGNNFFSRLFLLVFSSILFFIITNFGVWLISDFYTMDLKGILNCYLLAIPFFANTILSTFIFGMLFEIIKMCMPKNNIVFYK